MSRSFHPYGRPGWRRPISHSVHWIRWAKFSRERDPGSGQYLRWDSINWRWPKRARVVHNRKLRHKVNRLVRFVDHEAVSLPTLLEQYFGWWL